MYGKLFASMYDGTLYGHWQAIVAFQQMIVLCDSDGLIDMTPQAIAARTSIPLEIIHEGIKVLEEPDPYTRTPGEDGKRIARLDDHRPWGWRIINYHVYRDLVAQMDKRKADRERIAEKRAINRNVSHGVAERRIESRNVANVAHAEAEVEAEEEGKKKIKTPVANATPPEGVEGLDSVAWSQWIAYRTSIRKPVKPASIPAAQRKLAAHGTSQAAVVEHSIANGYTGLYASKDQPPQQNGGQKLEKIYPGYKF